MLHPIARALATGPVVAHGTTPTYAAWLVAQLVRQRAAAEDAPVWVVVPDDDVLRQLAEDVRFFSPELSADAVAELPGIEVSPYLDVSPDLGEIVGRVATLWRLAPGIPAPKQRSSPWAPPRLVITSTAALARRTVAPEELAPRGQVLVKGASVDRDALISALIAAGWQRVPVVDEPGTFAVRGGVIDVFSPLLSHPVRLELFGDELETLRTFDVESQRTLREIEAVPLPPVREVIETGTQTPRQRLRDHADVLIHPSKATRKLIEQLEANPHFVGVHGLLPAFHDRLCSPLEYAAERSLLVLLDPEACAGVARAAWADAEARHLARRDKAELVYPPEAHLLPPDELLHQLRGRRALLELPRLELANEVAARAGAGQLTALRLELDELGPLRAEMTRLRGSRDPEEQASALLTALRGWLREPFTVRIGCDTQARAERLGAILAGRGIPHRRLEEWPSPDEDDGATADGAAPKAEPMVDLIHGSPSASFASARDRLVILRASDLFGAPPREHRNAARRAKAALLGNVNDFGELEVGDHLVHQRHGVGRYRGLVRLPMAPPTEEGRPSAPAVLIDFLNLEYDGATLYLPVYRLGEVQRYVGGEGHAPRLDKLGGVTWDATRKKVSRHIQVLAEELLQIYAQRAALPGHAFPPADESYQEMEARFRFEETPDQLAAIDAVLRDMEAPRAMDRLICGDVGYGKTEVAMRALFRCVQGGKQAVLLGPTTVLVEQHVRSLTERFGDFPINIGKLSRFQSKAEQTETIKKLAEGRVDIVVGTHRLLSADVRFKNLGLIVIDEEQRFGVAHKERLRRLRTQVDCLTLTATPIPRTLHLAMTGLRDLSIIATPPADRRAVRTFVSRRDDAVIREAIERELARGGQIFWITRHIEGARDVNLKGPLEETMADASMGTQSRRAKERAAVAKQAAVRHDTDDLSIDEWKKYLTALVPQARIGVAHGQLAAEELEQVMVEFVSGQSDILIATTIVESGLDIPRANTMFVARADAFGLAQLYQLRGRIGRSKERAYCYLLVPSAEHLGEDALRRLDALQRFTELGAGFQIASRDLEIRGGGELLGSKQSGSIAAVGFDTYVRMLEEAVGELDGRPLHSAIDPELSAEIPGFIPDDYVPDPRQRLELYKRLSSVENDDELSGLLDEIQDRYGPVPMDALLLAELMAVKAVARGLGIEAIEVGKQRVAAVMKPELAQLALTSGWRKLADGRYASALPPPGGAPAAKRLLLDLSARGT